MTVATSQPDTRLSRATAGMAVGTLLSRVTGFGQTGPHAPRPGVYAQHQNREDQHRRTRCRTRQSEGYNTQ